MIRNGDKKTGTNGESFEKYPSLYAVDKCY